MRNTWAIAWKELKGYFGQPIAYVIGGMFLFVTGFFFVDNLSAPLADASIRGYALQATWVLFLLGIGALITMRSLAEEQKLGTIDLLLCNPVRDLEVILGKYLAAAFFFLSILGLSVFYPVLLYLFGNPDTGPILTGYLGIALLGTFAMAVGIFASSLTQNQIVAAVVSLGLLFMWWFLYLGADFLGGDLGDFVQFISLHDHYRDLAVGIVDTKSVIYLVSMTVTFLFLSTRALESRRWR